MQELQSVKQRFGIVGNSSLLNTALQTAIKVAATDMNVLIQGESGVGKESFSKIIHQLSARKHAPFIAVNCGAIPEGTIDSELFGHEKGSFTGASEKRKGYFESVSGGTIFLDEVGELPTGTQARLLRVLENGEFIKVGSSKVHKTDVRVVAATNRDLLERSREGKFREDLYYRLATVPIRVPRLSERKEDIPLLFRKFSSDFSETNHRDLLELTYDAQEALMNYPWPGNIRQLKNITEQVCVLENRSSIDRETLQNYLPPAPQQLPMLLEQSQDGRYDGMSERDIFYKVLVELRKDVNDLKQVVFGLLESNDGQHIPVPNSIKNQVASYPNYTYSDESRLLESGSDSHQSDYSEEDSFVEAESYVESDHNNLSLEAKEIELIKLALSKNNGKRKKAAEDLGISERTLYRKIKQYELD
ncbi:sigma-54 dependent transcriptional regulator [Bacteroidia bacterium]|nr:sigma-54 dependent transcriptional regulator [Bacteroidia bacterium]MDA9143904.1 sigma-54 dependent transcriptional regulator [Bacteroidia bacterium]